MSRPIIAWVCFLLLSLAEKAFAEEKPSLNSTLKSPAELVVCGDSLVQIVDVARSTQGDPKIVWEWNALEAQDLGGEYRQSYFRAIDDCKPIEGGRKILVTSSAGGVAIVDRDSKKVEFRTFLPMAHSIEILPEGHVAVAASTHKQGDCLNIYSLKQPEAPVLSLKLPSGHGVVFDKEKCELFALGHAHLNRYGVAFDKQNRITLDLKDSWKIPGEGGHDLVHDPRRKSLLVTDEISVWSFDPVKQTFAPFSPLRDQKNVKSLSVHPPTGLVAYVQADTNWWSERVRFLDSDFELKFPGRRIYKARWSP